MGVGSIVLGSIVFGYTLVYSVNRIRFMMRYYQAKKHREIRTVYGRIIEKVDEENKVLKGTMVNLCFPKCEYEIDGNKKYYQHVVRYSNIRIGQSVKIGYCERADEAWAIEDVSLMKRVLITRVTMVMGILFLLVLTEIYM